VVRTVELLGDLDRPGAWMLLVDGTPQSHVDLDDPRHLEFEYMRRLGHVIDLAAPPGAPVRALHLGGGGLTLARYTAATRPGSSQLAVEADPEVADLVRRRLPLRQPTRAQVKGARANPARSNQAGASQTRASQTQTSQAQTSQAQTNPARSHPAGAGRIRVRVADARAVLAQVRDGSFDVVIADVFDGARTPAHLTSTEFAALAARALAPGGVFAANVGDGPPLRHARGQVATLQSVFGHTCLIAEGPVLRGRRFGNLVVVAARQPLPVAELTRRTAADPFPARVLAGQELDQFVAGTRPVTDAHAEDSPAPPPDVFADRRQSAHPDD
jgi:spermidine synthase